MSVDKKRDSCVFPVGNAVVAAALPVLMLMYLALIVPHSLRIFEDFGVELPAFTLAVARLSDWATGSSPGRAPSGFAVSIPTFLLAGMVSAIAAFLISQKGGPRRSVMVLCVLLLNWFVFVLTMFIAMAWPQYAVTQSMHGS